MNKAPHIIVILQALLVTFLWSTSFIIIKWGLSEIHPITYAGLRYFLAFLCFFPFMLLNKKYVNEIRSLHFAQWKKLILLGFVFYTLTQGTQFLGLYLLPAVTVSLMLNFTPLIVAVLGLILLQEKPGLLQWIGSGVFILGILFYFFPVSFANNEALGLLVMFIGVLANSASAILGRNINRSRDISPVVITFVSMGIGATLLLVIGLSLNGIPSMSAKNWGYLFWLAIVNTALAFTLWNHTLRSLSAIESSIINGTMLIQIGVLAWIFLDERITSQEGIGMLIATAGAVLVQIKTRAKKM
ncbi:MAG: DMT family transporter [Candidatus Marinimicrobia bacterium]|nr:DMT family transporter [Candidatus Neomarinimicrobiota bacterium]